MTESKNIGRFTWHELYSPDPAVSKTFYGHVMGWSSQTMSEGDMAGYEMLRAGDQPAAGLMAMPEQMKAAKVLPHWIGYVSVPDVDATVARARELGARVAKEPTDIVSMGRFAALVDPQGAALAIFASLDPASEALPPQAPDGHFGWAELATENWDAAFGYYSKLFGWTRGEAMDMGEGAIYQLFRNPGTDFDLGGMFDRTKEMPISAWLYYVEVANLDAAAAAVKEHGGQVLGGPMEVPGDTRVVQCLDPHGAAFALHGK